MEGCVLMPQQGGGVDVAEPEPESSRTATYLHEKFLYAVGDNCVDFKGDISTKPIVVEARSPVPSPMRVYLYTLTYSVHERQQGAYRAQIILPGHREDGPHHFDTSDGAFVILAGYEPDLSVFVLWDAPLHNRETIPYSRGIQVLSEKVYNAANFGLDYQERRLRTGGTATEVVVTASANRLVDGLAERWRLTSERVLGEDT